MPSITYRSTKELPKWPQYVELDDYHEFAFGPIARAPDSPANESITGRSVTCPSGVAHSSQVACRRCWADKEHLENPDNGLWRPATLEPNVPDSVTRVPATNETKSRIAKDMVRLSSRHRYALRSQARAARICSFTRWRPLLHRDRYTRKRKCGNLVMSYGINQAYEYLYLTMSPIPLIKLKVGEDQVAW